MGRNSQSQEADLSCPFLLSSASKGHSEESQARRRIRTGPKTPAPDPLADPQHLVRAILASENPGPGSGRRLKPYRTSVLPCGAQFLDVTRRDDRAEGK